MLSYITIVAIVSMIMLSSYAYGSGLRKILNWETSEYSNILFGFTFIIGALNILIYPIVLLKMSSDVFLVIFILIIILPAIFIKKLSGLKLNKTILLFLLILFIRMFITYNRAIAEESFDTVHYLSYILEAARGSFLTQFDVNGNVRNWIEALDDFSSHYYVMSSIYRIVEYIKLRFSFDILTLTIPIVMWVTTIIYYVLNISLTFASIDVLKVKNRFHQLVIILVTQFFIGSFYYNSVFHFYGNTYRSLFVGVLVLFTFIATKYKKFDIFSSIMIMLASSAVLASSGSGYLISFIALYAFVVLMLSNKGLTNRNLAIMYVLFVPVILFVLNFLYLNYGLSAPKLSLFVLFYVVLLIITIVVKLPLQNLYRLFFYIIFPLGILMYSLKINQATPVMQDFFIQRSYTDMVWDYLSTSNLRQILFNGILWLSLILYTIKSKDTFSKYFIVVLVIFINPLTYPFIVKVLSYDLVFQRNYDALFNTFTISLLFTFTLHVFNRCKLIRYGMLVIALYLAQYSTFNNYHFYFEPEANYNGFYRLPQDQVEVFEVLNTKIHIEEYDRAVVVSQIPSIKGFVSNIYSVLDYNTYRAIDRFDETLTPTLSPLWNIFIPRDYYGQAIFSDDPDYENTCQYLIDAQVDFVLVDSLQFYMKDGDYVPLYLKVRDCAKEVYSNDRYILYQFYW